MAGVHSKLSPSSAEGWLNCPDFGNVNAIHDETGIAAAEGTFAHQIAAECLLLGLDAGDFVGVIEEVENFRFTWTDEDADLLQAGLDAWRERTVDCQTFIEQRVDLSRWIAPGQSGTLDRGAILGPNRFIIEDLKWGRGVAVEAVGNKQAMLYALGFLSIMTANNVPWDENGTVLIVIDQPRHPAGGGEWEVTIGDLLMFAEEIHPAAMLALQPDAPRRASLKGCMWCRLSRAQPGCPVFDSYMLSMFGVDADILDLTYLVDGDLPLDYAEVLTPERRAEILRHRSLIDRWLNAIHARTLDEASKGDHESGLKAVMVKRNPDKWKNRTDAETAARELVGDAAFRSQLRTPKQVSALCDRADLEMLGGEIITPTPQLALVPLKDARPAYVLAEALMDEERESDETE